MPDNIHFLWRTLEYEFACHNHNNGFDDNLKATGGTQNF